MVTPKLEELILKQKAKYYRATLGDSPLSVIPVETGKTLVITDIDIFANANIPIAASNINAPNGATITYATALLNLLVTAELGAFGSGLIELVGKFQQIALKGMITQLLEQSGTNNFTYTLNPTQRTNTQIANINNDAPAEEPNGIVSIEYESTIRKYDVFNIHTTDAYFSWQYPFAVDLQKPLANAVTNLINIGNIDGAAALAFINKYLAVPNTPNGFRATAPTTQIKITGNMLYNDVGSGAELGAWVPSGFKAVNKTPLDLDNLQAFNLVRYPTVEATAYTNGNANWRTVDYGVNGAAAANLTIEDTIWTYLLRPRCNIGYVIINENTPF